MRGEGKSQGQGDGDSILKMYGKEQQKMRVGIMQPYFLPYIGYWQLMNAVDRYVIYDDVNYINRGWINRNRILVDGRPTLLNIPLRKASQNKKINEIEISRDEKTIRKNLRMVELAYKKAPCFERVFPLYERIIMNEKSNLAEFLADSLQMIKNYLGISTELLFSSSLEKDNSLRGQDKILEICTLLNASEYVNAIGGRDLYCASEFSKRGIQLFFLKTNPISYRQADENFWPDLSILDVMMFNDVKRVREFLNRYTLI